MPISQGIEIDDSLSKVDEWETRLAIANAFEHLARRFLGPEVARVSHTESVAERFPTGSLSIVPPALPTPTISIDNNLDRTAD